MHAHEFQNKIKKKKQCPQATLLRTQGVGMSNPGTS
jgi:hypothetical protein